MNRPELPAAITGLAGSAALGLMMPRALPAARLAWLAWGAEVCFVGRSGCLQPMSARMTAPPMSSTRMYSLPISAAFAIAFSSILTVFYGPVDQLDSGARKWSLVFVGIGLGAVVAALFQVSGGGFQYHNVPHLQCIPCGLYLLARAVAIMPTHKLVNKWACLLALPFPSLLPRSPTPSTTWVRSWACACASSCSKP